MHIGRFTPTPYALPAATASVGSVTPPIAPLKAAQRTVTGEDEGTIVGSVPPAPTPEAREMVDKAAEVVQHLRENNRELHFSRDESSNRVVIEVRDLDGNVIKTIPPARALDVMSGAEL
jgi:uncharacterized FlaG/YvyC family protein